MRARLPANEEERLKALRSYEILDTDAELQFDDITLLASQICGTPIALVSLVDENRQWFKSKVGTATNETPRDIAFCAHGILQAEVLVVPDAPADARFATNPLVTGPSKIRFYAGAPLVTSDGHALGMLCVTDQVPRELSAQQASALQALSRQVVAQLDFRRRLAELRESEERFSGAFEHAPIGVALVAPDGRWLKVNRALCSLVGYSEAELLARNFQDITHPEDLDSDLENVRRMLAGEIRSYHLEKRYLHAHGHPVSVILNVSLVRDSRNRPRYFISQIQDITERRTAEQVLQRHHTELRVLFDLMPAMIWFKDTENRILRVNQQAAETVGKSIEEIEGKTSLEIYPEDAARFYADDLEVINSGAAKLGIVESIRVPDGQEIWLQTDKVPYHDENGKVIGLAVMAQDITERKTAEKALRAAEEKYRSIYENSHDGIFQNTPEGRTISANPALARILGYDSPEELVRERTDIENEAFAEPALRKGFMRMLEEQGSISDFEHEVRRKDGSTIWVSEHTRVVRDALGRSLFYEGSLQDITTRKRAEAEAFELKRFLRSTLDALSSHIAILDEHGTIIEVNDAWNRFGDHNQIRSRLRGVGDNYLHLCDGARGAFCEEAPAMASGIRSVMAGELECFDLEYPCHGPAEERWFIARITRFDGDGPVRVVVAHENISARKRAEAEGRQTGEKLQAIVNSLEGIVWEADGVTRQVNFVSQKAEAILGYPISRWLEEPGFWGAHLHPDDREHAIASSSEALLQLRPLELEYRMMAADGREVWFRDVTSFIHVPGKATLQCGLMLDITERKKIEEALRRQQTELRVLFDLMPAMVWFKDTKNGILRVNQRVAEAAERTIEEIEGRSCLEIYPHDAARFYADDLEVIDSGAPKLGIVETLIGPAGQEVWVQTDKVPVRDQEGKVIGIAVMAQDITEKRRAEEARRSAEEGFRTMANNISQLAWMADASGYIFWYNDRWYDYSGTTFEEMAGWGWKKIHHPDHVQLVVDKITRSFESGEVWDQTFPLRGRDGNFRWFLSRAVPIRDAEGKVQRWFGTNTDITESKLLEEELAVARDQALESARVKSEFLANMSHEIRTPMNGILGMTELVLETSLTDEQRGYLKMANTSGKALLGLINDILDFSKIEAGKLELEAINFNLRESLAHMLKPLVFRADQKQIVMVTEIAPEVPEHLIGDPLRLRQILSNFADNAIKFTKEGSITVKVTSDGTVGSDQCLHFSVTDTGIGIPEDKQKVIFEAFAQVDGSTTRNYGGTGLGLAIASHLVSQMRGKVWIESTVGEGTTFHFTARFGVGQTPPLKELNLTDAPAELARIGSGLRILLAEDNAVNRALANAIFTKRGHSVTNAINGREALKAATAETFDAIFMDVQMPEMDGFEATGRIREIEKPLGRHTPIVAMTAHAMTGDRERCLAAGMDDYISKPLNKMKLIALLDRITRSSFPAAIKGETIGIEAEDEKPAAPTVFTRKKLLGKLDGDDELMQQVVTMFQENTPRLLDDIRGCIARRGSRDLARSAHALLSSLGAIGADDAHQLTRQLEAQALDNNYTDTERTFAALERETAEVHLALAAITSGGVSNSNEPIGNLCKSVDELR